MQRFLIVYGALVAALMPAALQAAVVTKTYSFSAQNFRPSASPPPVSVVTGSFTVTFDDAIDVFDTTSGLVINDLNIPVTSTISYTYETGQFGGIRFGGRENGQGILQLGTNDLFVAIPFNFQAALFYTSTRTPNASFFTDTVSVQITNGQSAVPEPATWIMLLSGFALVGCTARKNRRRLVVSL